MDFLDVRTLMFSHVVTDAACTAVLVLLWTQNRKRFPGTLYWLLDFACQTAAVVLIVLRGSIPDWMSMGVSSTLVVSGALLGYVGLTLFVGKRTKQTYNYVYLAAFVLVHLYFVFVQPNLAARNLNVSLGLLVMCSQCAWLVFRRVDHVMRRMALGVGVVFSVFSLVSLVRIFVVIISPHPSNDFFRSGIYDELVLISYQLLLILLTFALFLMVNNRLIGGIGTQEEKFAKAFRSSPYGITLTQPSDGRIVDVNDGFVAITGYSYAEVIGKNTVDLRLWATEGDRTAVVDELSRGNRVVGREFQFRKKSGDMLTGIFSAEVIGIEDTPLILASIGDITERKRAEERLRELNEDLDARVVARTAELEIANREISSFAYSVAHDIRTPLRAMEGFSGILLSRYADKLDDQGRHYLDRIQQASQRMGQLINDLLNLSRITRGELKREQVDLGHLAGAIAAELKARDSERQVELEIAEPLLVQGDSHLLSIALQNLLDNAWKFSGAREKATIDVGHLTLADYHTQNGGAAPPLTAGELSDPRTAIYYVRDNGVGFDMAFADKLFSPFQRLHAEHEFPGTGIGLAIVHRIITRHGGRLWPQAELGRGATFYFTVGGAA
jgi:PAS domain S-box-containing protein